MTLSPDQSADSATEALERLASALTGSLLLPEDADWDVERQAWNRAIDQHSGNHGQFLMRKTLTHSQHRGITERYLYVHSDRGCSREVSIPSSDPR